MRRWSIVMLLVLTAAATAAAAPAKSEANRVGDAARVIAELRAAPDGAIPDIVDRARCVIVMPGVKKAAFIVGGEFGKGVVSCRTNRGWSTPVFLTLEKGSVGAQIGAESTDVVLLVMNEHGIERLLQDKVGRSVRMHRWRLDRSAAAAPPPQTHS